MFIRELNVTLVRERKSQQRYGDRCDCISRASDVCALASRWRGLANKYARGGARADSSHRARAPLSAAFPPVGFTRLRRSTSVAISTIGFSSVLNVQIYFLLVSTLII